MVLNIKAGWLTPIGAMGLALSAPIAQAGIWSPGTSRT